ncbi:MarR family transcriptional regulator [bacterium]|nr:MarR family transcriptional regulator [bacterium]
MMKKQELHDDAVQLAELTFNLLEGCHEKEARLAKKHGLSPAEFRCLRLFGLTEKSSNKKIAERMNLSPSRLSRVLDGLVSKGYMTRKIDEEDRRNMMVSLSRKGVQIVENLNIDYTRIHQEILNNIEQAQHKNLIRGMSSLLTALNKWMDESH